MDVVSLKILAGLVTVLDLNSEYGSMLRVEMVKTLIFRPGPARGSFFRPGPARPVIKFFILGPFGPVWARGKSFKLILGPFGPAKGLFDKFDYARI